MVEIAYTTPRTWVSGEIATAANLNTHLRDNVAWLATDSPACRAYKAAAQSVANTTDVALLFDSERFDNAAVHNTSSNTSRMTVPTGGAGKYVIGAALTFAADADGTNRSSWFYLNATSRLGQNESPINGSSNTNATPMTVYALSAADYVEIYVNHSAGAALNISGPAAGAEFFIFWFRI